MQAEPDPVQLSRQHTPCLHPLIPFCYICKVLVGPGTPYLGHGVRTNAPLISRTRGFLRRCIINLYRVGQFQVPGRGCGTLGLGHT